MTRLSTATNTRIEWLDAGRAVVLASMVWVNDIAGVAAAPAWMKHYYPYDANGMTFVDVVFPAFLFIVGMAIPAAVDSRRKRGEGVVEICWHVLLRTLGLLLAGVLMVNMASFDAVAAAWRPGAWGLGGYVALACLFAAGPWEARAEGRWISWALKALGAVGLVLLVLRFVGKDGLVFSHQWWGILGLIGWAYLVAAMVVLLGRGSGVVCLLMAAILLALWYADKQGKWFDGWWLSEHIDIGGALGTHASISLLGAAFFLMVRWAEQKRCVIAMMFGWVAAMGLAAAMLGPHGGFNKNFATPAWAVASVGCTVTVLGAVRGAGAVAPRWAWQVLCLAGTNVLLGYLVSGAWYQTLMATGASWYGGMVTGEYAVWLGVVRATAAALVNLLIVAAAARVGIRLRL